MVLHASKITNDRQSNMAVRYDASFLSRYGWDTLVRCLNVRTKRIKEPYHAWRRHMS